MAYSKIETAEDGTELVVYGASGIGCCPVALYYDRQGLTPEPTPAWLQEAYNQGNDNEQLILAMFQERTPFTLLMHEESQALGYNLGEFDSDRGVDYSDQVRVEARVLPGVVVRAHLDGLCRLTLPDIGWTREQDTDGKLFIVEVKALGDTLWNAWKSKGVDIVPAYPWQVSAQMKGAGLPCVFVVGHKGKDGKVYEIDYRILDEPPIKWIDVIKKIGAVEKGTVEDTDCPSPFMYPCPYYPLHNPDLSKGNAGIVVMNDDNSIQTERVLFLSLVEEVERHRTSEKHHKEMKERAQKAANDWLDERALKGAKLDIGPYIVNDNVSPREGPVKADKLVADGIDITKYKGDGYEVRYVTLTKKGAADKGKDQGKEGGK